MKSIFGILLIVLGAVILLWIAYNLLIERQAEFRNPIGGLLFSVLLIGSGIALMRDKRA